MLSPVTHAPNGASFKVALPSDRDILMTRLFDASRPLVFDALTLPALVKQWWCRLDDDYSVPVCEIDLRVGGAWRFVSRHPWGEACRYGKYQEVAAPRRLVFTQIFEEFPECVSFVTMELVEEGGKTRLTVTVRYPSPAIRDIVLASGMSGVAAISYDRLEISCTRPPTRSATR